MRDQFLTEPAPARGAALAVAPGVRRVVAPNPGPMTYHGTNTYLLDGAEGAVVIDPGPDAAAVLAHRAGPCRQLASRETSGHSSGFGELRW